MKKPLAIVALVAVAVLGVASLGWAAAPAGNTPTRHAYRTDADYGYGARHIRYDGGHAARTAYGTQFKLIELHGRHHRVATAAAIRVLEHAQIGWNKRTYPAAFTGHSFDSSIWWRATHL